MLVIISHIINVAVAGLVGVLLLIDKKPFVEVYGRNDSSRQILSCLYLSIAFLSLYALINQNYLINIALVLFPLQIIYKFLTLLVVKDKKNPVIWSNLAIALFHLLSLYSILV